MRVVCTGEGSFILLAIERATQVPAGKIHVTTILAQTGVLLTAFSAPLQPLSSKFRCSNVGGLVLVLVVVVVVVVVVVRQCLCHHSLALWCTHVYLHSHLPTYLHTFQPTSQPTYQTTYLPTSIPACLRTCMHSCIWYTNTCIHGCTIEIFLSDPFRIL